MKAVVINSPGSVQVATVNDPTPGRREAVIRISACGICGTDLHLLDGDLSLARYPLVPGHEFCGEVVARGQEVTKLQEGDFVTVDPSLFCGECWFCRHGRGNLCDNWRAIGVTNPGGCAEFACVPAANAFRLPESIPRAWGSLVEPLACAVHGFDQIKTRLSNTYLIYGAGTMGLLLAQLARHAGASAVYVVDTNASKLALAQRLAADFVAPSADAFDNPKGWDVVIDATGVVAAIEDGLTRVGKGGTFLMFGVAPTNAIAQWSPFRVYNEEITIIGSMAVLHSFERALALLARGVIDGDAMISHRLSLDQYQEAIEVFRSGSSVKVQVVPDLR